MARRIQRKAAKGFNNDFSRLSNDVRRAAVGALRNAAKEVLNDLAERGPNWRGGFQESWYVETPTGKRGVKAGGEGGKYNLFNIPELNVRGRDARGRFSATAPTARTELFIGNSAPHATQAMDLEPYEYPMLDKGQRLPPPKGSIYEHGYRPDGGMRGDVTPAGFGDSANPPNRSTAPLDWYSSYMNGGEFRAAFNRGAKAGFLEARNKPRPTQQ
jgi:hypothetical protein